jgi:uncharacterized protein YjbI with pentapeptide repeats
MQINRRHILCAAATTATAGLQLAPARAQNKQVSQPELDEAIRLHAMWLANITDGQQCMFNGRDLSGLRFGDRGDPPTNLSGANFTQADLSGTEADDILIDHCSFNGAKFDNCHWRQPVFAFSDLRRASAKQVIWGMPNPRDPLAATRRLQSCSSSRCRPNRSLNIRLLLRYQVVLRTALPRRSFLQHFFWT